MKEELTIDAGRVAYTENSGYTVSSVIDDFAVSFSSTRRLSDSVDPFACAFLLPALESGRPLVLRAPVDDTLFSNIPRIAEIAREWWSFEAPAPRAQTTTRRPEGGVGLFFTSGVDSFFTLRRNRARIDYLINVHGFDIEPNDLDRFEQASAAIRKVAQDVAMEAIFVRTDLRLHPTFRATPWTITHVAALAAVAHLLSPWLRQVHVASSDVPPPYGSHPSLDRLWSTSATKLINDEIGISRLDKVREIANWSLAQSHLKVCWENRAKSLNCGICEKCVRTQTQIATCGMLDAFKTFPPGPLIERIDSLQPVSRYQIAQWRRIQADAPDVALRKAVEGLIARSEWQLRLHNSERRIWSALSAVRISSKRIKALDARFSGGLGRRAYYALLRSVRSSLSRRASRRSGS